MPKSIALVISDLTGGGSQRVLTTMANALAHRGRKVTLITFADLDVDAYPLDNGVNRVVAKINPASGPGAGIRNNLKRVGALRRALKECGAEAVLSFIHTTNVLTLLATRFMKVKVVISERNDPTRYSLTGFWRFMQHLTYKWADVVTANSAVALKALEDYAPKSKLHILNNPLNIPHDVCNPNAHRVLAVGRLHEQKAHDVLIKAFAKVHPEFPSWQLSILGDGMQMADLHSLITKLGMQDHVTLEGWQKDIAHYYLTSSIHSLISRYEGTSNALLEAMAYGMPSIVTTSCPGSTEIVRDYVEGLVIAPDDEAQAAEALRALMADVKLRMKLGGQARERVAPLRTDAVVDQWLDVMSLD